ncbi:hypothetical protein FB451DRAFT_1563683 [Mycena latifolia]|nr:hypothetical protein FB451DRAFT_1563683 [Mycena latifolia]
MAPQFSFGPNSSYFLIGSGRIAGSDNTLPADLLRVVEDRQHQLAMNAPYDIAFPMEPDSYFGCWQTTRGTLWYEDEHLGPNYARLLAFIRNVAEKGGLTARTVFGPGASYFSTSPRGFSWQNLPPELEDEIQNSLQCRRPTTVALGVEKSYVALYDDGSISLELRGQYPLVEALLYDTAERSRRRNIIYIALNPFVAGEYYAVYGDGSARWNLPPAWEADVSSISHEIIEIAPLARESPGGTPPASVVPNASVVVQNASVAPNASSPPENKHHIQWEAVNQTLEAAVHVAELINAFQN